MNYPEENFIDAAIFTDLASRNTLRNRAAKRLRALHYSEPVTLEFEIKRSLSFLHS